MAAYLSLRPQPREWERIQSQDGCCCTSGQTSACLWCLLASHMHFWFKSLAILLLIQLLANVSRKAADIPGVWVLVLINKVRMKFLVAGSDGAQINAVNFWRVNKWMEGIFFFSLSLSLCDSLSFRIAFFQINK